MVAERLVTSEATTVPDIHPVQLQEVWPSHAFELLEVPVSHRSDLPRLYKLAKRTFDVIFAAFLIVMLTPVWIAIAVAVKCTSPGDIIFRQHRQGREGHEFCMLKFRSMVQEAEWILNNNAEIGAQFEKDCKLRNDPRVTKIGSFIRKTSLDELPQLFNILQGDMSFVGPRPIPAREMDAKYGRLKDVVLSVPPGLTGLWQVSGRSSLAYEERVQLDVDYVHQACFLRDLQIILLTIPVLVGSRHAC